MRFLVGFYVVGGFPKGVYKVVTIVFRVVNLEVRIFHSSITMQPLLWWLKNNVLGAFKFAVYGYRIHSKILLAHKACITARILLKALTRTLLFVATLRLYYKV